MAKTGWFLSRIISVSRFVLTYITTRCSWPPPSKFNGRPPFSCQGHVSRPGGRWRKRTYKDVRMRYHLYLLNGWPVLWSKLIMHKRILVWFHGIIHGMISNNRMINIFTTIIAKCILLKRLFLLQILRTSFIVYCSIYVHQDVLFV